MSLLRPLRRIFAVLSIGLLATALLLTVPQPALAAAKADPAFQAWLQATVWPAASARGVSRATFERATAGLAPDLSLPGLAGAGGAVSGGWQAEFSSPARYLAEGKIAPLVTIGRQMTRRWADTLAAVEARTGVPKEIIVAVWGRESGFGRAAIPKDAIRTLATLAWRGARKEMFLGELVAALVILEDGHIGRAEMKGSVAGALGQPQFLPSKYLAFAVDFDGDGRRDIWTSVPDTLASIGSYLARHGWKRGAPWGVEARLPSSVSCALEGPTQGRPLADWRAAGAARVDGNALPGAAGDQRFLMMPAGRRGPAFIVSENFYVLKAYNESDLYALFVAHVADRIAGGGPIVGGWQVPKSLTRGDVRAVQQRLVAAGYDVGGADGLAGFRTRVAIGLWQTKAGLPATCFPDADVVRRLK